MPHGSWKENAYGGRRRRHIKIVSPPGKRGCWRKTGLGESSERTSCAFPNNLRKAEFPPSLKVGQGKEIAFRGKTGGAIISRIFDTLFELYLFLLSQLGDGLGGPFFIFFRKCNETFFPFPFFRQWKKKVCTVRTAVPWSSSSFSSWYGNGMGTERAEMRFSSLSAEQHGKKGFSRLKICRFWHKRVMSKWLKYKKTIYSPSQKDQQTWKYCVEFRWKEVKTGTKGVLFFLFLFLFLLLSYGTGVVIEARAEAAVEAGRERERGRFPARKRRRKEQRPYLAGSCSTVAERDSTKGQKKPECYLLRIPSLCSI